MGQEPLPRTHTLIPEIYQIRRINASSEKRPFYICRQNDMQRYGFPKRKQRPDTDFSRTAVFTALLIYYLPYNPSQQRTIKNNLCYGA